MMRLTILKRKRSSPMTQQKVWKVCRRDQQQQQQQQGARMMRLTILKRKRSSPMTQQKVWKVCRRDQQQQQGEAALMQSQLGLQTCLTCCLWFQLDRETALLPPHQGS
jgi:hypothetical protein